MNVVVSKHYYCAFVLDGGIGGGGGAVLGGGSASAGENDLVRQNERPIMKLKILFFGFPTYICTILHSALLYFLALLYTVQNKKCLLSCIQ